MTTNAFRTSRLLLAATLFGAATAPALAVEAFTANYNASALGMSGEGQMVVAPQPGNRWQYTLTVRNQAVDLSQKTVFDEQDGRMRPLNSSDSSRLLIKKKNVNTVYDWSKAQATWTGDIKPDRAGPVKLQAGDMDALLVNLAIVRDVAAGKPLTYRMVENGRAKAMTYQVAGKERITVGGKAQDATKVVRTDGDKQTIVWVVANAPVPARILQRENGQDTIDLTLKSWR
ncbi:MULTISPECIES: DUF3108 domain-containing protein [unclassified Pseudoxanthomonas]|uniref:DUF3108 domain-containing protein n=1 Tax=unclassified Pseudoxanthomonas TaxID=2645906 RepID=UPI0008E171E0|nr:MULTISPECIES: DUF3108 domain-containing protein [unclassified Pseudoxanthomonas]PPJ43419.1 DUF3108 domain-containing protein [Pseudoxanthomonas sp. KAs_5_3]SFV35193.1 Protein of unknown function [Pseudoxanthomonas sp. YR558]